MAKKRKRKKSDHDVLGLVTKIIVMITALLNLISALWKLR